MAVQVSYEEALRRGWIDKKAIPSGATVKRVSKREIEGDEQAALIDLVRARFPVEGAFLIHIPNGGSRKNAFEGWRLKRQGVRAGVSDLLLPVARGGFFGLWIEFKAAPPNDAAVSPDQLDWIEAMQRNGYQAQVCLGVPAALAIIEAYLALPPTRVQPM